MPRAVYIGTALVAALCPPTPSAQARAPDCAYDRCALRVQWRGVGDRVVQGVDATPVASIGLFAPRVDPLATAGDSARVHYQAFRRYHNRAVPFSMLAWAAFVGAMTVYVSSDNRQPSGATWALVGVSLPLGLVGGANSATGRDHLYQAIWFYNRSTLGSSVAAEQPPESTYDARALRIRRTLFSKILVQGRSAKRVARLGEFPPLIDLLAVAGDSSRHHYVVFRRQSSRAATLHIVSLVFAAASGFLYGKDSRNRGVANTLLFSGLAINFAGSLSRANADSHLQDAIWFHNRSLPR